MKEIALDNTHTQIFDSWTEYVNYVKDVKTDIRDGSSTKTDSYLQDFTQTRDMAEALELARLGWPEGYRKMKNKLSEISNIIPSKAMRKEMAMSIVGPGTLDMNRYQMGHPQSWVTWEDRLVDENSQSGKIITIIFNFSISAYYDEKVIFDKGSLICLLIDELEKSGKRVELIVSMATCSGGYRDMWIDTRVTVKRAEDSLDIDRVAFSLAHPSMFRRMGFACWESNTIKKSIQNSIGVYSSGGYGRVKNTDFSIENSLVIKGNDLANLGQDSKKSEEWIRLQLKEFGVEFDD